MSLRSTTIPYVRLALEGPVLKLRGVFGEQPLVEVAVLLDDPFLNPRLLHRSDPAARHCSSAFRDLVGRTRPADLRLALLGSLHPGRADDACFVSSERLSRLFLLGFATPETPGFSDGFPRTIFFLA
jgi:hypothetical protein